MGQWLKPGQPNDPDPRPDKPNETRADKPFFCEIGDPHHLEAHLVLDQADIHLIHPNDKAWLKVYGKAETTYKSSVEEIAKHTSDEIPLELSSMAEGEIAAKPDPKTGAAPSPRRATWSTRSSSRWKTPTSSWSRASADSPRSTAAAIPSPGGC